MRHLLLFCVLALSLIHGGCARKNDQAAAASGHGHHHTPPHGGTAIALGNEAYHLELVHDPKTGGLTAYVLDGHMENFIRTNLPTFEVTARVGGESRTLQFRAVANAATGETAGDTSQFEAQADWLRTTLQFEGTLRSLSIRGTTFNDIAFRFPEGNESH